MNEKNRLSIQEYTNDIGFFRISILLAGFAIQRCTRVALFILRNHLVGDSCGVAVDGAMVRTRNPFRTKPPEPIIITSS